MENKKVEGFILLYGIDDIVVMNTYRASQSSGYGFSTGYQTRYGTRRSSGTSKTIGDIVFIVNGQKSTWGPIPDPTGLKNLIKSIKREMYDPLTKLANKSSQRGGIPCPSCGLQNPKTSKFCYNCGENLASVCSKCGTSNPLNSSFCGKCGSQLSIGNTVESSNKVDTEVVEQSFRECILKEYNIKINYPSTWTRRDDTTGALKVLFQSPKENLSDHFLEGLGVSVDEKFGNMTLQNYIESNIASLRKSNSDFTLFESTPTTLSGIPAHQFVYLANNMKFLVVVIARNNVFYFLLYCSKPESYLKFLSSVEQMISSFAFLD